MTNGEIGLTQEENKNNLAGGHSSESDFTISRPSLFFYTMKDAYYFPHDSNAQSDPKILQIRSKHDWKGYALYFATIEKLREATGYKIPSLAKASLHLCFNVEQGWLAVFYKDCIEVGLFSDDGKWFYSDSLLRRMLKVDEIRNKLKEAGRKGGLARVAQAGLKQPSSIKGKERKVNKRIEREKQTFIPPTLEALKEYIKQNNYSVNAEDFLKYFTESGWVDSKGNKVRNWKQKIITWNNHQPKNNDRRSEWL
jgi:hypothetical protein